MARSSARDTRDRRRGGIRIERLARDLNIAKSGFYWHFKDRKDLLNKVLDYWAYEYTSVVAQNPQLQRASPESRLNQAARMIRLHKLTKYDVSMRAWAEHDAMAAEAVAQVYQMRLAYIREAFRDLGFKGDELEMRTRLYVCYHSWETAMFGGGVWAQTGSSAKTADQTTDEKLKGEWHLLELAPRLILETP